MFLHHRPCWAVITLDMTVWTVVLSVAAMPHFKLLTVTELAMLILITLSSIGFLFTT